MLKKQIRPIISAIFVFSLLTGALYPLAVTAIAQILFPEQANGSLILKDGKPIGSTLIGQPFDDPKYFWGRLSATTPFPYNSSSSGGSNFSQMNPDLARKAEERIKRLKEADPEAAYSAPADLVTSSGSGLDPHISPAAAEYQIRRISKMRGMDETSLRALVKSHTEDRWLGIFGEPRINVLQLNLALDGIRGK